MATCPKCGKRSGFLPGWCDECSERESADVAARYAAKLDAERSAEEAAAAAVRTAHRMTTTALHLPGFEVAESLGVVRGICVRSRGMLGNFVAGVQADLGGEVGQFTTLCEQTRTDALMRMWAHAAELGGDAVIGFHYETNELAPGIAEVLCYGTAVRMRASNV